MLAAVGSGVGATVIVVGAIVSAVRFARARDVPGHGRRALANVLIALGTLVLSSGGLIQGVAGKDEAFVLTLAVGISVIYAGFSVARRARGDASGRDRRPTEAGSAAGRRQAVGGTNSRRRTLPDWLRGSSAIDVDRGRHLVPGEPAGDVVPDRREARRVPARAGHHERDHRLAGAGTRHADDRDVLDVGMRAQHVLHLRGVHVEARRR